MANNGLFLVGLFTIVLVFLIFPWIGIALWDIYHDVNMMFALSISGFAIGLAGAICIGLSDNA